MPLLNYNAYLQEHPDLQNNWNAAVQYQQNPNDPRWANDPNVKEIASFGTLQNYLQSHYNDNPQFQGGQFETAPATGNVDLGGATVTPPSGASGNNGNSSTGAPTTDWTALIPPVVTTPPSSGQVSVPTVSTPAGGGNYNQTQNSGQAGAFSTIGQNTNVQQQQSGQTQNQNVTGSQTTATDQTTTGTQTQNINQNQITQALDSLGFGQLLKDQAGSTVSADNARRNWLLDTMQTGGSGFNSQVDQAVRGALTGPQVTGAGDSARARMGAYAASDIARKNLDQRLGAANQLAGGTGLTSLSTAANPYIGSSQNTTGTNTTTSKSNTTGTSTTNSNQNTSGSSTGWQNLVSQGVESQAGTTAGAATQVGAGNIPQGQPVKTGGCVLCTAATELGYEKNLRVLRRVISYKLGPGWKSFRLAARGYFAVFGPFADFLLDHPRLAKTLYPLARKVVYEELRISGRKLPFRLDTFLVHWLGDGLCRLIGLLPVSGYVTQPRILSIARKNNILFQVEV